MTDAAQFRLGQVVYFAVNGEKRGIVTAILWRANGVVYGVTWDDLQERWHAGIELSAEKILQA